MIRKLQELLGSSYSVTKKKSRGQKTGPQPWQQHHGKAEDVMRHIVRDGEHSSILERFQKDLRYKESQLVHGWNETWCKYLDYIRTNDISHNASREQRGRYAKMWKLQNASANHHYKEATERITSFAFREGDSVKYITKEERHRTDALDPDYEKCLIWLSENWHTYCANDGSSSNSSSSISWHYSWWTGNSKWYWNDDVWKDHKW